MHLKLRNYSLLALAALGTSIAEAKLLYTDIDPDSSLMNDGDVFQIDLNQDGIFDHRLHVNQYSSISTSTIVKNRIFSALGLSDNDMLTSYIQVSNSSNSYYSFSAVQKLEKGDLISSSGSFSKSAYFGGYVYYKTNSNTRIQHMGPWKGVNMKYMGLRIKMDSVTYGYGWARASINSKYDSILIHDFAYQDCPNVPILAGDSIAILAPGALLNSQFNACAFLEDVGNNGNASDFRVSIDFAAGDKDSTMFHRVILIDQAHLANFTIDSAKQVKSYVEIAPQGGGSTSFNFDSTFLDAHGQPVVDGKEYVASVLSIPNGLKSNMEQWCNEGALTPLQNTTAIAETQLEIPQLIISNRTLNLTLKKGRGTGEIQVFNTSGQLLRNEGIDGNSHAMSLIDLSPGIYVIHVIMQDSTMRFSKKVVLN